MKRIVRLSALAAAASALLLAPAFAQEKATQTTTTTQTKTTVSTKTAGKRPARSNAWKIRNAESAAPAAISKKATVMDQPDTNGQMAILRKGSNEWTCMPDDPTTPANDPMCLDKNAMEWGRAWKSKQQPNLQGVGIGYMLQGGGSPSNTDPFATKPEAGKMWLKEPPHLMVFGAKLDPNVYSTDPTTGKPWIMWAGTPYEHLMVPVK
ncbi:MAG: hypothetical protein ACE14M_03055 [Terriglobales bacterium]